MVTVGALTTYSVALVLTTLDELPNESTTAAETLSVLPLPGAASVSVTTPVALLYETELGVTPVLSTN